MISKNDNKKVAIIIINYNGNEDTLQCLKSIDQYCIKHDYSVLLVDNASHQPINRQELTQFKVAINYIISPHNLGFAGGNNLAIEYIKDNNYQYDYLFLQNNDTILIDDSLDRLVDVLEKEGVEIGGLVNYFYDCPSKIWQAGSFIRASRLSGREMNSFHLDSAELIYVDSIPGSSMLIKSEVVQAIGLFDERYFAYYEEMDFCTRAKENGYKVSFLPDTRILHKVGRSSTSKLKHYLRTRNTLLFYSLHYKQYMTIAYLRILLRTIRNVIETKFDFGFINPFWRGVYDYKKGIFFAGSIGLFGKNIPK